MTDDRIAEAHVEFLVHTQFSLFRRCGARHRSEVEERLRDRGSGLLQLVDESDRRLLPRGYLAYTKTKL